MKIGLLGYGKMGKAIEQAAVAAGETIVWTVGSQNRPSLTAEKIREADVVIECSRPEAAYENIIQVLEAGVPVVTGTTGWLQQYEQACARCRALNGTLLVASNFSIGVNLFFSLNEALARWMENRPEYTASLEETHHVHKLDAPSGTAISLANGIIRENARYSQWHSFPAEAASSSLAIEAKRIDEVPGTHVVRWTSATDAISMEHQAFSRTGFAQGAVMAARWIQGKKGIFSMRDFILEPINELK